MKREVKDLSVLESQLKTSKELIEDYRNKVSEINANISREQVKIEKLKHEINVCNKKHFYTYIVVVDDEIKYIGKGSHDRWKHAISGASSVKELNRDYFEGKHIEVFRWNKGLDEEEALQNENLLVYNMVAHEIDIYNKVERYPLEDRHHLYYDVPYYHFIPSTLKLGGVNEPSEFELSILYEKREDSLDDFYESMGNELGYMCL